RVLFAGGADSGLWNFPSWKQADPLNVAGSGTPPNPGMKVRRPSATPPSSSELTKRPAAAPARIPPHLLPGTLISVMPTVGSDDPDSSRRTTPLKYSVRYDYATRRRPGAVAVWPRAVRAASTVRPPTVRPATLWAATVRPANVRPANVRPVNVRSATVRATGRRTVAVRATRWVRWSTCSPPQTSDCGMAHRVDRGTGTCRPTGHWSGVPRISRQ